MQMESLSMTLSKDKWEFQGQGKLLASCAAVDIQTDENGIYDYDKIGLVPSPYTSKLKSIGLGAAIDAGLSINILPWITASAAIIDFGKLRWGHEIVGVTDAAGYSWEPAKGEDVDVMGGSGSDLSGEISKMKDAVKHMYQFKKADAEPASGFEDLPFRFNAGVEIRVPFYQRLSVGALYTVNNLSIPTISDIAKFNLDNLRFSANWSPLNFLSASVTTTMTDLFHSYGAALNFHPALINLFIGIDAIPANTISAGGLIKDMLPSQVQAYSDYLQLPAGDLNLNAYVGLSLSLGKRQIDYRRMSRQILKEKKEKEIAKQQEREEKELEKARERDLKELERLQKEEAKQAVKNAKEREKAAKVMEKQRQKEAALEAQRQQQAAKEAKEQEKREKEAAKEQEKREKEAAREAAKAGKAAEREAKAQKQAEKAAQKAAEKTAALEAQASQFEEQNAQFEEAPAAEPVAQPAQAPEEAKAAETLLETVLEEKSAPAESEAPQAEAPAEQPATEPAAEKPAAPAPAVFAFPNL